MIKFSSMKQGTAEYTARVHAWAAILLHDPLFRDATQLNSLITELDKDNTLKKNVSPILAQFRTNHIVPVDNKTVKHDHATALQQFIKSADFLKLVGALDENIDKVSTAVGQSNPARNTTLKEELAFDDALASQVNLLKEKQALISNKMPDKLVEEIKQVLEHYEQVFDKSYASHPQFTSQDLATFQKTCIANIQKLIDLFDTTTNKGTTFKFPSDITASINKITKNSAADLTPEIAQSISEHVEKYEQAVKEYFIGGAPEQFKAAEKDINAFVHRLDSVGSAFEVIKKHEQSFKTAFSEVEKNIPHEEGEKIKKDFAGIISTHKNACKIYLENANVMKEVVQEFQLVAKTFTEQVQKNKTLLEKTTTFTRPSEFAATFKNDFAELVSQYIPANESKKTADEFEKALNAYKTEVHKHLIADDKSKTTALTAAQNKIQTIIGSYQEKLTLLNAVNDKVTSPNQFEAQFKQQFATVFAKIPKAIADNIKTDFNQALSDYKAGVKTYLDKKSTAAELQSDNDKVQVEIDHLKSIANRAGKITPTIYLVLPEKLEEYIKQKLGSVSPAITTALVEYKAVWNDYLEGSVQGTLWLQYTHLNVQKLLAEEILQQAPIKDGFIHLKREDFTQAYIASVEEPLVNVTNQLAKPLDVENKRVKGLRGYREVKLVKGLTTYGEVKIDNGAVRTFIQVFLDYKRQRFNHLDMRRASTPSQFDSYSAIKNNSQSVMSSIDTDLSNAAVRAQVTLSDMDKFTNNNNQTNLQVSALLAQSGLENAISSALVRMMPSTYGQCIHGADGRGIYKAISDSNMVAINVNDEKLIIRYFNTNHMNDTRYQDDVVTKLQHPPLTINTFDLEIDLITNVAKLNNFDYYTIPQPNTLANEYLYMSPGNVQNNEYKDHFKSFPNNLAALALIDEVEAEYRQGHYQKAFEILNRQIPQINSSETLLAAECILGRMLVICNDQDSMWNCLSDPNNYLIWLETTVTLIEQSQHYRANGLHSPMFEVPSPHLEKQIKNFNPERLSKKSIFSFAKFSAALKHQYDFTVPVALANDASFSEFEKLLSQINENSSDDEISRIIKTIADIEKQFDELISELSKRETSEKITDPYVKQDISQSVKKAKKFVLSILLKKVKKLDKKLSLNDDQILQMIRLSDDKDIAISRVEEMKPESIPLLLKQVPTAEPYIITQQDSATLKKCIVNSSGVLQSLLSEDFMSRDDAKNLKRKLGELIANLKKPDNQDSFSAILYSLKQLKEAMQRRIGSVTEPQLKEKIESEIKKGFDQFYAQLVSGINKNDDLKSRLSQNQLQTINDLAPGKLTLSENAAANHRSVRDQAVATVLQSHIKNDLQPAIDSLLTKGLKLDIDYESINNAEELLEELNKIFILLENNDPDEGKPKAKIKNELLRIKFVKNTIQDEGLWHGLNRQQQHAIIRLSPGTAAELSRKLAYRVLRDDDLRQQLDEAKPVMRAAQTGYVLKSTYTYAKAMRETYQHDLKFLLTAAERMGDPKWTKASIVKQLPSYLGYQLPTDNASHALGQPEKNSSLTQRQILLNLGRVLTLEKQGENVSDHFCKTQEDLGKVILMSKGEPQATFKLLHYMLHSENYNQKGSGDPNIFKLIKAALHPVKDRGALSLIQMQAAKVIEQAFHSPTLARELLNSDLIEKLSLDELAQLAVLDKTGEIARELLSDKHTRWFSHGKLKWHPSDKLKSHHLANILNAHSKNEAIVTAILGSKPEEDTWINAISRWFTLSPDVHYAPKLEKDDLGKLFKKHVRYTPTSISRILRTLSTADGKSSINPSALLEQTASRREQSPLGAQLVDIVVGQLPPTRHQIMLAQERWSHILIAGVLGNEHPIYTHIVGLAKLKPTVFQDLTGKKADWIKSKLPKRLLDSMRLIIENGTDADCRDLLTKDWKTFSSILLSFAQSNGDLSIEQADETIKLLTALLQRVKTSKDDKQVFVDAIEALRQDLFFKGLPATVETLLYLDQVVKNDKLCEMFAKCEVINDDEEELDIDDVKDTLQIATRSHLNTISKNPAGVKKLISNLSPNDVAKFMVICLDPSNKCDPEFIEKVKGAENFGDKDKLLEASPKLQDAVDDQVTIQDLITHPTLEKIAAIKYKNLSQAVRVAKPMQVAELMKICLDRKNNCKPELLNALLKDNNVWKKISQVPRPLQYEVIEKIAVLEPKKVVEFVEDCLKNFNKENTFLQILLNNQNIGKQLILADDRSRFDLIFNTDFTQKIPKVIMPQQIANLLLSFIYTIDDTKKVSNRIPLQTVIHGKKTTVDPSFNQVLMLAYLYADKSEKGYFKDIAAEITQCSERIAQQEKKVTSSVLKTDGGKNVNKVPNEVPQKLSIKSK